MRFWSSKWWARRVKPTAQRVANQPRAEGFLFLLEVVASILLPIPVVVALVALITAAPRKWWRFAVSATIGSALAAIALYFIGRLFFDALGAQLIAYYGIESEWQGFTQKLTGSAGMSLLVLAGVTSGITRLTCLAAGFTGINPLLFITLLGVSRSARLFAQCAAIKYVGEKVQTIPKSYYRYATLALCLMVLLALLLFALLR